MAAGSTEEKYKPSSVCYDIYFVTFNVLLLISDLEADLNGLRKWLHDVESQVLPLHVKSNWTVEEIEQKLKEHQVRTD